MVCKTGMPNDNILFFKKKNIFALNNPNVFKVESKQGPNI